MKNDDQSIVSPDIFFLEFAIACASMAIAGAGLSIIAIWLSGVYFHIRRRARNSSCCLLLLSLLVLIVCKWSNSLDQCRLFVMHCRLVCCSFVVWILLISETVRLGNTIDRRMFRWPMWLAVGATGGYLISFLLMSISFCATFRRRKLIKQNYYHQNNQF